ncbi:hypothetical protein [Nonomuraea rhizosphaerae]|uniref:hypothetical protein n=1 Tax=Nonomuraea rhizosphaerae TaxID=2665663 RepID=UPI001C5D9DDC|nr:hypothetical protein [Nonomuraea rhizosphaerae]
MKRIITGLALATAATLVAAAPAQAAPRTDPLTAVKKQFVAGKGVRFSERSNLGNGKVNVVFVRRTGAYQFSGSGVAASDATSKFNPAILAVAEESEEDSEVVKVLKTPERIVSVRGTTYASGGLFSQLLPEGKTWYKLGRIPFSGYTGIYGQPLNITEPATLRALLKGAKPVSGGYAGKITVGSLRKISPSLRGNMMLGLPSKKTAKVALSWKLTVNAKGLPTRLVTKYPLDAIEPGLKATISVDTRFTGWGTRVSIAAPPADQVTSELKDSEGTDENGLPSVELPLGRIAQ